MNHRILEFFLKYVNGGKYKREVCEKEDKT